MKWMIIIATMKNEHGSPEEESHEEPILSSQPRKTQSTTMAKAKPKGNQASRPMANSSIITTIDPSRHIFRGWNPQSFPIYEDVGIEVGKHY
jgi:hypothetical protein